MEDKEENQEVAGSPLSDILSSIILLGLIAFGLWFVIHFGTHFLVFFFNLFH